VFADADRACDGPFALRRLEPNRSVAFTTHAVSPGAVLGLARTLFGSRAAGFVLGIRGHDFDGFGEGLSVDAARNLALAVDHLDRAIRGGELTSANPCLPTAR